MGSCIADLPSIVNPEETKSGETPNSGRRAKQYIRFPRDLLNDKSLDGEALVMLLPRFQHRRGKWKPNPAYFIKRGLLTKGGYYRARKRVCDEAGLYSLTRQRAEDGRFAEGIHAWKVPTIRDDDAFIPTRWTDIALEGKHRGLLMWLTVHPGAFSREIQSRFGIGDDTAQAWLEALIEAGLAYDKERRDLNGQFAGTAYWASAPDREKPDVAGPDVAGPDAVKPDAYGDSPKTSYSYQNTMDYGSAALRQNPDSPTADSSSGSATLHPKKNQNLPQPAVAEGRGGSASHSGNTTEAGSIVAPGETLVGHGVVSSANVIRHPSFIIDVRKLAELVKFKCEVTEERAHLLAHKTATSFAFQWAVELASGTPKVDVVPRLILSYLSAAIYTNHESKKFKRTIYGGAAKSDAKPKFNMRRY